MEAEIKAGAKLDMLTKSELQEVMDGLDFNVKIGRGLKFRRIEMTCPIVNGEATQNTVGPESGFTWAITFFSAYWFHTGAPSADAATIFYRNEVNPSKVLGDVISGGGQPTPMVYPKTSIIIHSGESIYVQIWDAVTPIVDASPFLQVAFHVIEVPTFSEGLLNL